MVAGEQRIYEKKNFQLTVFSKVYEITRERVTDRRSNMLNILASTPDMSETTIWQHLCHTIETLGRDIPMAILYSAEEDVQSQRCRLRLEGSVGIHPGHRAAPQQVEIHESAEGFLHSFRQAKEKDGPVVFECLPPFLADGVAWRGFGEPSRTVVVLPFLIGGLAAGFLVIGLNPRRVYDEDYQRFVQDLRLIASTTIKASIDFQKLRVRELQLSRELSEKEKFVRRLAELAPVGMFNLDTDGVLTWANAKCELQPVFHMLMPTTSDNRIDYEITGLSSKPEGKGCAPRFSRKNNCQWKPLTNLIDNFELSFMNCILEEGKSTSSVQSDSYFH